MNYEISYGLCDKMRFEINYECSLGPSFCHRSSVKAKKKTKKEKKKKKDVTIQLL